MELNQYFEHDLFILINSITKSRNCHKHSSSVLYKDLRTARIQMVIGILCLLMIPQCCFIQTLTGLLCYAYGLRDKGSVALNAMRCCCSVDHIRFHGAFWANRRQPIQNMDVNQEWCLSTDNLNFYMKFAKNLPESGTGANKMLNPLTFQVSHQIDQISNNQVGEQSPPSLKDLVTKSLS